LAPNFPIVSKKSGFQNDYSFHRKRFANQLKDLKIRENGTIESENPLGESSLFYKHQVQTEACSSNSLKQQKFLQSNSREFRQSFTNIIEPFEPFQIGTLRLHCYCFDLILESLHSLIIKIRSLQDKLINFVFLVHVLSENDSKCFWNEELYFDSSKNQHNIHIEVNDVKSELYVKVFDNYSSIRTIPKDIRTVRKQMVFLYSPRSIKIPIGYRKRSHPN
jgi:hypothetical protein